MFMHIQGQGEVLKYGYTEGTVLQTGQKEVHKCKTFTQWDRVTNQRIGQEDVHKCKIHSHSGTGSQTSI